MHTRLPSFLAAALLAVAGSAFALPHAATLEEALPLAKEQNRSILLDLTGKDWCPACIHMETKVLGSEVLEKAVGEKYMLVEVDYPRDPKKIAAIPEDELRRREDILKTFKVRGLPCFIYLDPDGLPYAVLPTVTRTPEDYLPIMAKAEEVRAARDAALAHASTLQGMEKAKALVAALELLPESCRGQYKAVLAEIRTLDPENTLGYSNMEEDAARRLAQLNAWEEAQKAFFASLMTHAAEAENVAKGIEMGKAYLEQEGLIPEVRQNVWRFLSEGYALQRNIPAMCEALEQAVAAAPDTELGRKIQRDLKYLHEVVLPALEVEKSAREGVPQPAPEAQPETPAAEAAPAPAEA